MTKPHTIEELDSRVADGITVRLLWDRASGDVVVAVTDAKTGEAFELLVGPRERALDVFRHPFAYAASRARPSSRRQLAAA